MYNCNQEHYNYCIINYDLRQIMWQKFDKDSPVMSCSTSYVLGLDFSHWLIIQLPLNPFDGEKHIHPSVKKFFLHMTLPPTWLCLWFWLCSAGSNLRHWWYQCVDPYYVWTFRHPNPLVSSSFALRDHSGGCVHGRPLFKC